MATVARTALAIARAEEQSLSLLCALFAAPSKGVQRQLFAPGLRAAQGKGVGAATTTSGETAS